MSIENPLWGAPRIHGELLKLGFDVAQSSVAKYMTRRGRPGGQGWRTFLRNHTTEIAVMDLFVVPTIGFELLYAFVIVRLDRRHLVWINVTTNPTAEWVARLRAMGIRDKPIAPAPPWQNGYAERLIGLIRRECLDHVIVLGEAHLRKILRAYGDYYNRIRTHRALNKDVPISRPVQRVGLVAARPILGGLHHHYARS
jgi:transposase InsO family protein